MTALFRSALAAPLLAAMSLSCNDSGGPSQGFVVTGTIENHTGAPIPANTRLLVVWVVSSTSPDYSYVFGEGTINPAAGTFRVQLNQAPPTHALNQGNLGVGIVVATTNQSLATGDDISAVPETDFIGAAGRHGIIFIGDQVQHPQWATEFDSGYGVGVGVDVPEDFDRFAPAAPSSVVLIIDDLQNIDFVNWT